MDVLERPADRATLQQLFSQGLLSAEARLAAFRFALSPLDWSEWISRMLLGLGGGLFLAGIVYYFAFNWEALGKWIRLGIPEAGIILAALAARALGPRRLAGQLAGFAAVLGVGIFLAVFGQIYQTGADAWELFAGWALIILPWVLLGCSASAWMLWVILVNVASMLFIVQVVPDHPWVKPVTVSLLIGALNALALGAREAGALRGLDWLKNRWHREVLLVFVLSSLSVPVLELILDADAASGLHFMVLLLLLLVLATMRWFYVEKLPDLFALSLGALYASTLVVIWIGRLLFEGTDDAGKFLLFAVLALGVYSVPARWLRQRWQDQAESSLNAEANAQAMAREHSDPHRAEQTGTEQAGTEQASKAEQKASRKDSDETLTPLPSLSQTFSFLERTGKLSSEGRAAARAWLEEHQATPHPPWFISALMGAGAWTAAYAIIGFLAILDLLDERASLLILGVLGIGAGIVLRRQKPGVFLEQLALAFSLTGKGLVLAFFADQWDDEWGLTTGALLVWSATYPFTRDRFDRFLSTTVALAILLFQVSDEANTRLLMHLLLLGQVAGLGALFCGERVSEALRPAAYALALVFAMTLIFPYYGPLAEDLSEWPVRIGLCLALAGLVGWAAGGLKQLKQPLLIGALVGLVVLTLTSTSGILAGIGFLILGYALSDRILIVFGLCTLMVFGIVYYYMLELTLLSKALALCGSGAAMLAGRLWLEAQVKTERRTRA